MQPPLRRRGRRARRARVRVAAAGNERVAPLAAAVPDRVFHMRNVRRNELQRGRGGRAVGRAQEGVRNVVNPIVRREIPFFLQEQF